MARDIGLNQEDQKDVIAPNKLITEKLHVRYFRFDTVHSDRKALNISGSFPESSLCATLKFFDLLSSL